MSVFNKLFQFECPDFFTQKGNLIFIIEHFEFDSSKRIHKGSTLRRNKKKVDDEIIKNIAMGESSVVKTVQNNGDAENYLKNLFVVFNKHYKQIDTYKTNLLNKLNINHANFKIIFFIVDKKDFGSYACFKGDIGRVLPFSSSEFKGFLKEKDKIDYVLMSQEDLKGHGKSVFMSRKEILSKNNKTIEFRKHLQKPIEAHTFSFTESIIIKAK